MTTEMGSLLPERLAEVLPEGCRFTIHHVSTPPTQSRPLYTPPPGGLVEETYCESHFLSVSIDTNGQQLQVFGIEVLIYSTEYLTTLFVSKADSTGYLHLLRLRPGTPSPLKAISTTFLRYLIDARRRSDRSFVLSLFARAQNQYLFPGSIENSHKHVLDDRGLIKWWCKVVDPILVSFRNATRATIEEHDDATLGKIDVKSRGYLRVPGCDTYETRSFLPKGESGQLTGEHRWYTSDPLAELGRSSSLPERCLIPRFPDDPKARFLEELDDELPEEESQHLQSWSKSLGRWRSVRSLEQFWEMMSYRQECSSGRLVGFLWATFQPASLSAPNRIVDEECSRTPPQTASPTPDVSQHRDPIPLPPQSPVRSSPAPELPSTPLKQRPAPSRYTPTTTPHKMKEAAIRSQPEQTKYYYWPTSSRGELVLRHKDYQRASNLLLRLDYANEEVALDSSRRWINDVADRAGVQTWGRPMVGTVPTTLRSNTQENDAAPTMLNAGLIRKKKRPAEEMNGHATAIEAETKGPGISMLSAGLLRKKVKVATPSYSLVEGVLDTNGSTALG